MVLVLVQKSALQCVIVDTQDFRSRFCIDKVISKMHLIGLEIWEPIKIRPVRFGKAQRERRWVPDGEW